MSKEIINADGSRNYQANILLDNVKRLEAENKRLQAENERLEQLYQDEHCEVLRLQKGLKYIEKYTHSPIADTVRMGIIRNTIKELLNDNK